MTEPLYFAGRDGCAHAFRPGEPRALCGVPAVTERHAERFACPTCVRMVAAGDRLTSPAPYAGGPTHAGRPDAAPVPSKHPDATARAPQAESPRRADAGRGIGLPNASNL